MEARPIKGTTARSEDPAVDAWRKAALVSCEKSRAENLMIVDLLRNDLGRFCRVSLAARTIPGRGSGSRVQLQAERVFGGWTDTYALAKSSVRTIGLLAIRMQQGKEK